MLVTIPFFAGDKDQAVRLANWIRRLGGVGHHDCLLVADKGTNERGVVEPCQAAFRSVTVIRSEPVAAQGKWGDGTTDASAPNEMWLTAQQYVYHKFKCRWFWLEPDTAPTRSTWADEIEAEDREARKPFMGAYVNIPPHEPHMTGIAVYPPNVPDYSMDMALPGKIAWDYAGRRDTVGKAKAHFTKLIQHEYRIHGAAPTFPDEASLSVIKPETAVFHRCKDSTLIERLQERLAAQKPAAPKPPSREQTLEARVKELEEQLAKLSQRNGGDAPCQSKSRSSDASSATDTTKSVAAPGRKAAPTSKPAARRKKRGKRGVSAEIRARISAAQKARWAARKVAA